MKHFKRVLSLVLVLALMVPGMVFANQGEELSEFSKEEQKVVDDFQELIQEILDEQRIKKDLQEDYKDEEVVRVIVELDEKPVIVQGTELGQKYEDMSYSQKSNIESKVYSAQEAVKNQISARNISMEYERSFNTIFSGFSGQVEFIDIETIEDIPGVKKVYISNEYRRPTDKPNMGSSHDMIGNNSLQGKYKGEGMLVAIIDTGIDPSHKDFVLSEGTEFTLKENSLPEGLKGKFFTDKVPYGYNYYDQNNEILDLGPDASEHGMHVAGTVVANGELKGVAPEAQALAMKVFSNDPVYATTFDDIYMEAMEEAIKLKADVLNMSLGSTASFYLAESAIDEAITNAVNNGIVCSISAGNSGHASWGWEENYGLPFKQDPDYGVVGSPGLTKDSLQVASIENLKTTVPYLTYSAPGIAEVLPRLTIIIGEEAFDLSEVDNNRVVRRKVIDSTNAGIPIFIKLSDTRFRDNRGEPLEDLSLLPKTVTYFDQDGNQTLCSVLPGGTTGQGEEVKAPMTVAGHINPAKRFGQAVEYVDCGIGGPEDFKGKDIEGKVALIIRGELPFTEKIENAEEAKASGVIIYNNQGGGEDLINMQYPDEADIPAVFIGYKAGSEMLELEEKFITFSDQQMDAPNPTAGQMSDFTSWGTTPTLELKPEITAPGGQIYSTLQNDQYGTMSGTSMSAPHVAGGSALVMQYLKQDPRYKDLTPSQQTRLAKVLLMNTAGIVTDPQSQNQTPYSPRRQGAGLMDINGAVSTDVRVVNTSTNEGKVELKDFNDTEITMNLKAINDSEKEMTYNIEVDVLADAIVEELGLNVLETRKVNAVVTGDETVTIPAKGEKEFTITIDFSKDPEIYENMFIEGFVKLVNDDVPTISLPYLGFYGDWDKPRILDGMIGEEDSYYEFSGMVDSELRFHNGKIAFTPGTMEGMMFGLDTVTPVPTFLRNAEKVEYNILDKDENKVRTIRTESFVRKNYIDGGRYNPYSLNFARKWDGKVKDKVAEDGLYYYQIRAKVQNGGWQEKNIPVYLDTVGPEITNMVYDEETGDLTWEITDKTSGALVAFVDINGKDIATIDIEEDETEFEINIKDEIKDGNNKITVLTFDNAMNSSKESITVGKDEQVPYIYLSKPDLLEAYNKSTVEFNGYVLKNNDLKFIKIDGNEVGFEFVSKIPVDKDGRIVEEGREEKYVSGYKFNYDLENLKDGIHQIKVETESEGGKNASIVRRFYVDTEKPELEIEVKDRELDSDTADLEITMKDNFSQLRLYVFDSEEFNFDGGDTALEVIPAEETTTVTVDLELGMNTIPIKVIDFAGNETNTIIEVERKGNNDDDDEEEVGDILEGEVDFKYGKITEEGTEYLTYIQFTLKDKSEGKDVKVKVNDELLEGKEPINDEESEFQYDFRFEGMVEDKPESVIIIIDDVEFDISEHLNFQEAETTNYKELMKLIELMGPAIKY